jgi:hypothetical protein
MTYWTNVTNWLAGWPLAFASLAEIQTFCEKELGLTLVNVRTGEGCTKYVFAQRATNAHRRAIVACRSLIPLRAFRVQLGFKYAAALPDLEHNADSAAEPCHSQLMVYKNGLALGLAHCLHDHIVRFCKGRHSRWNSNLYFSSSDGSDPNTNGLACAHCERF